MADLAKGKVVGTGKLGGGACRGDGGSRAELDKGKVVGRAQSTLAADELFAEIRPETGAPFAALEFGSDMLARVGMAMVAVGEVGEVEVEREDVAR